MLNVHEANVNVIYIEYVNRIINGKHIYLRLVVMSMLHVNSKCRNSYNKRHDKFT